MFRKSGHHFFDKNMLKALIWREFFPFRRFRLNGKRAGASVVVKRVLAARRGRFDAGVGEDDELSHDGGDGLLRGLSGRDELFVLGFEVRIEAHGDESRHGEGLTHMPAPAVDEGLARPCAGLSRSGRRACSSGCAATCASARSGCRPRCGLRCRADRRHAPPPRLPITLRSIDKW